MAVRHNNAVTSNELSCGTAQVFEQCCEEDSSCPTLRKLVKDKDMSLCETAPNRCDENGRLTHLSLSSEGLECKFPKAVAKLTSLTRLDLTFNDLDGRRVTCVPGCKHAAPVHVLLRMSLQVGIC